MAKRTRLPPEVDGRCVFCGIAEGTQPASVVADEGDVLAFVDLQPVQPGHLLVIPRGHAANLGELPAEAGAPLFSLAHRLASALRRTSLRCDGVNLFLADGPAAGQEIWHVHLHVIPRIRGDHAIRFDVDWRVHQRDELDGVAAEVCAALN